MKQLNKKISIKYIAIIVLCSFFLLKANGQPNKQNVSVHSPNTLKIDGKLLEWPGAKLQAHNHANDIWYTISNDDDNIYLTVRAPYRLSPSKILREGLTFTLNTAEIKKEKNKNSGGIAITFPVLRIMESQPVISTMNNYNPIKDDTLNNIRAHDSLINIANTKMSAAVKEIKVIGINDIQDTLISIYNTTGIKAIGMFNRQMDLIVEMAIPLKYLGNTDNKDVNKINYNIKLKGQGQAMQTVVNARGEIISQGIVNTNTITSKQPRPDQDYLFNTTDVSGEYILAKKP